MIIYKVTNLINNKVYVGKTTNSLPQRRAEHIYLSRINPDNNHFHNALYKHGPDSFKWDIETVCSNENILNESEKRLIELLQRRN